MAYHNCQLWLLRLPQLSKFTNRCVCFAICEPGTKFITAPTENFPSQQIYFMCVLTKTHLSVFLVCFWDAFFFFFKKNFHTAGFSLSDVSLPLVCFRSSCIFRGTDVALKKTFPSLNLAQKKQIISRKVLTLWTQRAPVLFDVDHKK